MQAISLDGKGVKVSRTTCNNCAKCVDVCYQQALKVYGSEMSVQEVLDEVKRDVAFYEDSGGGVTASGGEPLKQAEFVVELFKRCQETGIHTALDTAGYASTEALERVLEYTDLVLFDLKHVDPAVHLAVTDVGIELILENAKRVVAKRVPMIIRVPVIPTITDSEENIIAIARFAADLREVTEIGLLPYHRFGIGKYEMLDRPYQLYGLPALANEQVDGLKQIINSFGFDCKCG